MATMSFMSCAEVSGGFPKFVRFDSSPGRAIAKRLGDGMWDEKSYRSELRDVDGDMEIYEVFLRRSPPLSDPYQVMPEQKVGSLRYVKPSY